jgi:hypothetical protein
MNLQPAQGLYAMASQPVSEARERPATPRPDARTLPQILYIMGTGRSGTTILEVLLANNPGFAGVGEVHRIVRHGFLEDRVCSCSKPARQCEVWSRVLRDSGWSDADLPLLARDFEKLESHFRFPLVWAGAPASELARYDAANEALFTHAAAARRSFLIVDSSKYASRALLLARRFPDRVKVLCITRSAAGLIAAFQKRNQLEQRPKPPLAVAAYYCYVLLCMRLVRARLKERCLAIRFEELNREPLAELRRIESWLGLSLAESKARIASADAFEVGHIVTGNRLRMKGRVKFEPTSDDAAKRNARPGVALLARGMEAFRRLMGF